MERIQRRIGWMLGLLLVLLAVAAAAAMPVGAEEKPLGHVTVTVERTTLGQGLVLEPASVPFYSGDTAVTVLRRALGADRVVVTGNKVTAILGVPDGGVAVPRAITAMGADPAAGAAPDTASALAAGLKDGGRLADGDYSALSQWRYTVNGQAVSGDWTAWQAGAQGQAAMADGDVLRCQFSLWGQGADLGLSDGTAGIPPLTVGDKSALIRLMAAIDGEADKAVRLKDEDFKGAWDEAWNALTAVDASQARVDRAEAQLDRIHSQQVLPQGITLSAGACALDIGDALTLTAALSPAGVTEDALTWTSSDPSVAAVGDDGQVTAVSAGQAVVTAATVGGQTASCTVTVGSQTAEKHLTAIALYRGSVAAPSLTLAQGRKVALAVVYTPGDTTDDKAVAWTSSDPAVAAVAADGTVSGTAPGTAVVSARVGGLTAACAVTVPAADASGGTDGAAAASLLQSAAGLNANAKPTLDQVRGVAADADSLTDAERSALTEGQTASIASAIQDGYTKVVDAALAETDAAVAAARGDLTAAGDITDGHLYKLVRADKALTAASALSGLGLQDQARCQVERAQLDSVTAAVAAVNASDQGVTVAGLPWTVKVKAARAAATADQTAALAGDYRYTDPVVAAQYAVTLKDFSRAASPASVPDYDTGGQVLKVTLGAFGDYRPLAAAEGLAGQSATVAGTAENRTLCRVDGGQVTALASPVAYDGLARTFSFETADLGTYAVVADSRVAITSFTLSDSLRTLTLGGTTSFKLSVASYLPADTTDLDRITYTSSDTAIATVAADGTVKAVGAGTAVITADICGVTQNCAVVVNKADGDASSAYWTTFRKDGTNMAIVSASLPNGSTDATKNLTAKWMNSDIDQGAAQMTCGTPLVMGDSIYVATQNKKLYRLNKSTGAVTASADLAHNIGFFSFITYGDGKIFVPEVGGVMEAFDLSSLSSLWTSEAFKGQSNCQTTYAGGCVYSGTWSGTGGGTFFCLDATNGSTKWKAADTGGYYWAGAVAVGRYVVFGGDSGVVYVCDQATGTVVSQYDMGGLIRGCIAYDAGTGAIYFTGGSGAGGSGMNSITGDPKCYQIKIDPGTGTLGAVKAAALPAISTTTPVVYNGRVYVSTQYADGGSFAADRTTGTAIDQSSATNGKLAVIDAASMTDLYNVDLGGPSKASPLLTTAYTGDGRSTVYLYLTVNCHDGAIVRVKDYAGNTTPDASVIFRPDAGEQEYTTTSLNCDADGIIYYRNDKGHLFALTGTSEAVKAADTTGGGSSSGGSASGTKSSGTSSGTTSGTTASGTKGGTTTGSGGSGSSGSSGSGSKSAAAGSTSGTGWSFDTSMAASAQNAGSAASKEALKQVSAILGGSGAGIALVYTGLMALFRGKKRVKLIGK